MHLKLKVAGWDYKIHWNKSSLGFGCSLKLTPGGCIWPLSLISVKHALHLFTCQAVSLHFRVLYTSHWTERKTCSAGLLKVQNWVAKSPTMSVLCWIREGRATKTWSRRELCISPTATRWQLLLYLFVHSQLICKTIQLSTHLQNKRLLIKHIWPYYFKRPSRAFMMKEIIYCACYDALSWNLKANRLQISWNTCQTARQLEKTKGGKTYSAHTDVT